MFKISISLLVIASLLSASCSSTRKSLALGLTTGAVTGATIGSISSRNHSQGALTGLALGAVVGGIASYFIHGSLEERDKEGEESGNNKGVGCVPTIATATNALNSLK